MFQLLHLLLYFSLSWLLVNHLQAQTPMMQVPTPSVSQPGVEIPTPMKRGTPHPSTYDPQENQRRQQHADILNDIEEYSTRKSQQERQRQDLIEDAIGSMKTPQKLTIPATILQESDLSPQRRAEMQAALSQYDRAYQELSSIYLNKKSISIKRAVYLVENAYVENTLSYESYCQAIQKLVKVCWQQIPAQQQAKPSQSAKHLALYKTFCDTTWRYNAEGQRVGMHLPMRYDFQDYWGEEDYRQVFVTKLMEKGTGQCHSLPLLYKILAEEMKTPAYLSYAPNHAYIQHPDEKGNWYNLELTNGRYVTKSAIMNFGYVKFAALKNRVYMDTLSLRQTVGACLIDLALGYDAKFGAFRKDAFIGKCCELVLSQEPNHVQALIVRANLLDFQLNRAIRQSGFQSPNEVTPDSEVYKLHQLQEQTYARIDALGYAEMPKAQYEAWRASLGREQLRRQSQSLLEQMQPKP